MATPTHETSGHHSPLALLQPWIDFVPQPQRRLGLFIAAALALHVAVFFFIRIESARAEIQRQPRTHVTVENARSAEEGGDAFLDSLADPRLFLLPVEWPGHLSPDELPAGPAEVRLGSAQGPPAAGAPDYPLIQSGEPTLQEQVAADMRPARQPFSYQEEGPAPSAKTMWQWDPVLASRQPVAMPDLPSPVSDTDLNPTELRVAVDAPGTVQHVMLEESCQKPELDQQAILAARKLRFHPAAQPGLTWGRVTIFWHCTAPPREVVVPTPPTPPTP